MIFFFSLIFSFRRSLMYNIGWMCRGELHVGGGHQRKDPPSPLCAHRISGLLRCRPLKSPLKALTRPLKAHTAPERATLSAVIKERRRAQGRRQTDPSFSCPFPLGALPASVCLHQKDLPLFAVFALEAPSWQLAAGSWQLATGKPPLPTYLSLIHI